MNNLECVLDYGHGGTDPGACSNGYQEKVWNKDTGEGCKAELERHGVKVHLTRKNDETLSLNQRCEIANKTNAKWFISIHHNAGGGDRGETIHSIHVGEGKKLADNIGIELKAEGQSSIKTYSRSNSSNKDYYAVIRGTKMKACIVEVCFIDNISDRQIADTKEERIRNGVAIAHGILKTMGVSIKESSNNNISNKPNTFKNGDYSGRKARVTASVLNVRYDRGTKYKVVGKLKKGDIVNLQYCLNGWISIDGFKGNKGLGYVSVDYLELI